MPDINDLLHPSPESEQQVRARVRVAFGVDTSCWCEIGWRYSVLIHNSRVCVQPSDVPPLASSQPPHRHTGRRFPPAAQRRQRQQRRLRGSRWHRGPGEARVPPLGHPRARRGRGKVRACVGVRVRSRCGCGCGCGCACVGVRVWVCGCASVDCSFRV